jgi:hypothetical protein
MCRKEVSLSKINIFSIIKYKKKIFNIHSGSVTCARAHLIDRCPRCTHTQRKCPMKPSPFKTRSWILCGLVLLLLSACGGSSTVSLDNGHGSNSNANATLAFDQVVHGSNASMIYGAVSQGIEFGARAHLSDVGADASVTGKGVTIAIIDDFVTAESTRILFPSITRKSTRAQGAPTPPSPTAPSRTSGTRRGRMATWSPILQAPARRHGAPKV